MASLLMMIGIGGAEFLVLTALIGGVAGYFFRNKASKNGAIIGVVLGVIGGVVTTVLLMSLVFGGMILMPVYAILGAWLFNFLWSKISK